MTDEQLVELLTLTCETDEHGVIKYRNRAGQYHRIHGPAQIYPSGTKWWYINGQPMPKQVWEKARLRVAADNR